MAAAGHRSPDSFLPLTLHLTHFTDPLPLPLLPKTARPFTTTTSSPAVRNSQAPSPPKSESIRLECPARRASGQRDRECPEGKSRGQQFRVGQFSISDISKPHPPFPKAQRTAGGGRLFRHRGEHGYRLFAAAITNTHRLALDHTLKQAGKLRLKLADRNVFHNPTMPLRDKLLKTN